jgi:DNA-binding MarR family transcriptional regulator
MSRERARLHALVGAELGALIAGARAVTAEAAVAFAAGHAALRPAAFHVARWLKAFGPARAGDIAAGVVMDKSAVSRLLGDLESAGFVERRPAADDARAVTVALSARGSQQLDRALDRKGAQLQTRLSRFSRAELDTLLILLRRLNEC